MRPASRRYHLRSIVPMMALIALTLLPQWLPDGLPAAARITVRLLPLLPAAWLYLLYLRFLRESDELERKLEVEALGLSAVATMLVALGGLLLHAEPAARVDAQAVLIAVLLAQAGSYFLSRLWLRRRYGGPP